MDTLHLRLLAAALGLCAGAAAAQVPAAPASSPSVVRPAPPLRTPEEKRDESTMPGDLRPENPVVPQLKLPLGRTPPDNAPKRAMPRRDRGPGNVRSAGVDDSAARCAAQGTSGARAQCNDKLDAVTPAR